MKVQFHLLNPSPNRRCQAQVTAAAAEAEQQSALKSAADAERGRESPSGWIRR